MMRRRICMQACLAVDEASTENQYGADVYAKRPHACRQQTCGRWFRRKKRTILRLPLFQMACGPWLS